MDNPLFHICTFGQLDGAQLYSILQLRAEVFVVEQSCIYQDVDGMDLQSLHVMGLIDNRLAVYARILPKGIQYPDHIAIGRVVTAMLYRGKGWGRQLMQYALDTCHTRYPSDPIKISAQQHLEEFYGSLGFDTVGTPYLEDGILHVSMLHKRWNPGCSTPWPLPIPN